MTLHSDDLNNRQDEPDHIDWRKENEAADWLDVGLIIGACVGIGLVQLVQELCRLPGRVCGWLR